jgi:hypothetical protein
LETCFPKDGFFRLASIRAVFFFSDWHQLKLFSFSDWHQLKLFSLAAVANKLEKMLVHVEVICFSGLRISLSENLIIEDISEHQAKLVFF